MTLSELLKEIKSCTHCASQLPCAPNPVLRAHPAARLRIVGQAPGKRVHETGIPWNDRSGDRLRAWMDVPPTLFYDKQKVAITPMGFCYPGTGRSGDQPPRPECAPRWHDKLNAHLPQIKLTLLIGQYAHAYYLGPKRKATLGKTVMAWEEYAPLGYFPLVHPSPRNQLWLKKNPWFERELVPALQQKVKGLGLG